MQMTLNITNDTEHYKEFKNNQRTNQGISSFLFHREIFISEVVASGAYLQGAETREYHNG
jgi:hypothetical protein